MKPVGIFVGNSKPSDTKITLEIIASTPSTTCELVLTKHEAEQLVLDLMSQVIKISDE